MISFSLFLFSGVVFLFFFSFMQNGWADHAGFSSVLAGYLDWERFFGGGVLVASVSLSLSACLCSIDGRICKHRVAKSS